MSLGAGIQTAYKEHVPGSPGGQVEMDGTRFTRVIDVDWADWQETASRRSATPR